MAHHSAPRPLPHSFLPHAWSPTALYTPLVQGVSIQGHAATWQCHRPAPSRAWWLQPRCCHSGPAAVGTVWAQRLQRRPAAASAGRSMKAPDWGSEDATLFWSRAPGLWASWVARCHSSGVHCRVTKPKRSLLQSLIQWGHKGGPRFRYYQTLWLAPTTVASTPQAKTPVFRESRDQQVGSPNPHSDTVRPWHHLSVGNAFPHSI